MNQPQFIVVVWILLSCVNCYICAFITTNGSFLVRKLKRSPSYIDNDGHQVSLSIEYSKLYQSENSNNQEVTVVTNIPRSAVQGITLKIALDMNGGVACRSEVRPERFTCSESLNMVHRLRAKSDAVLIGIGTAISDNPSLLVRRPNITITKQPFRVVIDPMLKLISKSQYRSYQLLSDGYPLIIYHCRNDTETTEFHSILNVVPSSVQLHYIKPMEIDSSKRISVEDIVHHLQDNYNVQHIMVEGGPNTASIFLQSNLIDRCMIVNAPIQFQDPILSNITPSILESANLIRLGTIPSGVDTIECWSRTNVPWPTSYLQDWP